MKAWQLQGFGLNNLVLNDIPQPEVGPGEALMRISSVSLNFRDKLLCNGPLQSATRIPHDPGR
jgi:NADPH:quinone reductase-like Zn-dependent oxidoreductase